MPNRRACPKSYRPAIALLLASAAWIPSAAEAQADFPPASPYPVLDDPQAQQGPAPAPAPEAVPLPAPMAEVVATAPQPSRFSLGAALAFTYRSETNSSMTIATPVLGGLVAITSNFLAEVVWGFALMLDSETSFTGRVGNPWIKGWYRNERGPLRWYFGLGITAPLASVDISPDGRTQRALYNQSAAVWGLWDDWRFRPDRMAVPIPAGLTYTVSSAMDATFEAALAPVIGVRQESGTDLLAQFALGARFLIANNFWICPRLQAVVLPSASVDRLQTAAGLRVEWTPRLGRFFLGALVNLDEPLGVFGRGDGIWSIHLGKELGL
jgi:hypothetical protein